MNVPCFFLNCITLLDAQQKIFYPKQTEKDLVSKASGKCSFPNCKMPLTNSEGIFIGEICHFEAISAGGSRFNPHNSQINLISENNHILQCPTHHRLVDSEPFIYTSDWLKKIKEVHDNVIREATSKTKFRQRKNL